MPQPKRATHRRPGTLAAVVIALLLPLASAPLAEEPSGRDTPRPASATEANPSSCSDTATPPEAARTVTTQRALLEQLARARREAGARPIALNGRGYNYGTAPDLPSELGLTTTDARRR